MIVSYAQHHEDLIILSLLGEKKTGFYVDAGANDPTSDSVTKLFYLRGWHGVNIEPLPSLYKKIVKQRPKDINVNVAISNTKGTATIREYGLGRHGLSTLSDENRELAPGYLPHTDFKVKTNTLKSILRANKVKHIDFMKIDVEGLEQQVIESNDWNIYRPEIVIVEDNPGSWQKKLQDVGYKEVFFDGLNRYYSLRKHPDFVKNYRALLAEEHITYKELQLQQKTDQMGKKLQKMYETYNELADSWHGMHTKPEKYVSGKVLALALLRTVKSKITRS